jgi:hypothetical protein
MSRSSEDESENKFLKEGSEGKITFNSNLFRFL